METGLFIGVDLAWAQQGGTKPNETGVAAIDRTGTVIDCGWTFGTEETLEWILRTAGGRPGLAFVDAPLVVDNPTGQRLCEREVGQRYGRWKVSANSTNQGSPRLAGLDLRKRLEAAGWTYDDGRDGPPSDGRFFSECYPYTTLVGAAELGYDQERPRYKRPLRGVPAAVWQEARARECDGLIARLHGLATARPPLLLDSHEDSGRLLAEPSPRKSVDYKHREDLIDALLCAWTASLWAHHGLARCQVLGATTPHPPGHAPTIIARPARSSGGTGARTRPRCVRTERPAPSRPPPPN
ncbi:DUF429 domain-containing protein [Streptomyces sp. NPDC060194]|uniref:DUF429 domain-containing protein n=1 Tax=Streptomyces sp. NPDC060194 TaxID=3347069 RepID=UPI00364FA5A5